MEDDSSRIATPLSVHDFVVDALCSEADSEAGVAQAVTTES